MLWLSIFLIKKSARMSAATQASPTSPPLLFWSPSRSGSLDQDPLQMIIAKRSRISDRLAPGRPTDGGLIPTRIGGIETVHVAFTLGIGVAVLELKLY